MAVTIKIKRGTRSQIDAAAGSSGLNQGELYLITDEGNIGLATSSSTYETYVKSTGITAIVALTQSEYDAIGSPGPDPNTLYFITGELGVIEARTGASAIKTANFTFTAFDAPVMVDTSGGAITGTLPASPSTGDRVRFMDGSDFSAYALTIDRNSELIEGASENCTVTTQGTSGGFVFIGGSTGWKAFK